MNNYIDVLKLHLEKRKTLNSHYSLRAFSRDIGLSPGSLVNILAGRQNLSLSKAEVISRNLELSGAELEIFEKSVMGKSKSVKDKKSSLKKWERLQINKRVFINARIERVLSSLHHLVISDFLVLNKKVMTYKQLEKEFPHLKTSLKNILEDLENAGFLEKIGRTKWVALDKKLVTVNESDICARSIQFFHHQVLLAGVKAIAKPKKEREFQSMIVKIHKGNLSKYKKRIQSFFDDLEKEIELEEEDPDDIFVLGTQFFSMLEEHEHE